MPQLPDVPEPGVPEMPPVPSTDREKRSRRKRGPWLLIILAVAVLILLYFSLKELGVL